MKKGLLVLVCFFSTLHVWSLNYCQTAAFGYGKSATGGAGGSVKTVTSGSALSSALSASGKAIIVITQNISITSMIKVKAVDKTLLALPGVTISNLKQDSENSGILYFKSGSKNLIIRNLTLIGPGAYDCDGNDLICFDGVTNAWVDHCDFQDGCDGNFDNKGTTDNVTVSWCRFRYLKAPKAGGSGGADDHRFSNLLGSSSSDKPSDGTYNFTWAYCWWDSGCKQRMVRGRNASLHFLNCYWGSNNADYYIGPENMDAYVEGCYFGGSAALKKVFYQDYGGKNGVTYVNSYCNKGTLSNVTGRTVTVPSYTYEAFADYTAAKNAVSNTSCGAGATLTVTTAGAVSSTCDEGGDTPDPGPTPPPTPPTPPTPAGEHSFTWNISDPAFAAIAGSITATTTINGLTIVAKSDGALTIDEQEAKYGFAEGDTVVFVNRLKTGGSGKADCRHIKFDVTGPCTIEVWAKSSSSSEDRTINIYTNSLSSGNLIGTLPAPKGDLTKQSFSYTGGPATIVMGSASSGVNFYAINIVYPSPTDIDQMVETSLPRKIIHRGQLFILHHGRYYNVLGHLVN